MFGVVMLLLRSRFLNCIVLPRIKEGFIVDHMQFKNGLVYWELNVIQVVPFLFIL